MPPCCLPHRFMAIITRAVLRLFLKAGLPVYCPRTDSSQDLGIARHGLVDTHPQRRFVKHQVCPVAPGDPPTRQTSGKIERIGQGAATLTAKSADGAAESPQPIAAPDPDAAATQLLDWLDARVGLARISAIGHRIVHGGHQHSATQLITPAVVEELRRLCPLDPEHLPGEIAVLIEGCGRRLPKIAQVACFDTAFHHDLPRVAALLPIPLHYFESGIRRYGFHGISYAFLMEELAPSPVCRPPPAASSWHIWAMVPAWQPFGIEELHRHHDGVHPHCRAGDGNPQRRSGPRRAGASQPRSENFGADALDELVNRRSGLLGLSETSADVRRPYQSTSHRFAARRRNFGFLLSGAKMGWRDGGCTRRRRYTGIRRRDWREFSRDSPEICQSLAHLGIRLNAERNAHGTAVISADDATCAVRIIHTDEESMIARDVRGCWASRRNPRQHSASFLTVTEIPDMQSSSPSKQAASQASPPRAGSATAAGSPGAKPAPGSVSTAQPLSADELRLTDAYWRAANYLSVGQIYLYDNPLLKEPLQPAHVKPRLLGHWGTTPGQNFVYVHLNRVIRDRDLDMIYIAGPGHGGPALVANTYLEGTYSEFYPHVTQDEAGLKHLFKQFSFPGGIPSHVAPKHLARSTKGANSAIA